MRPEGINVGWGHEGGGGERFCSNWGEDPSEDGPWDRFEGVRVHVGIGGLAADRIQVRCRGGPGEVITIVCLSLLK